MSSCQYSKALFTDQTSFAIMLIATLAVAAWFARRHGKHYALGSGVAVSFLAGTWFEITVLDTSVNVTMATSIILLWVYCAHSWREIFKHLNLLDILIGGITIWHFIVDVYYDGQPIVFAAQAYGHWMLPYAAGRYAFLHPGTLSKLSPLFTMVAALVSVAAIYEAFTYLNFWEFVFAQVDDDVTRVEGMRYGMLYRAMGPVRNPIFLGTVLLTMLPYAIDLISRNSTITWHRIAGYGGAIIISLGIVATVSRGPILCLPIAIAFGLAWWNPVLRWGLAVLCLVGGVIAFTNLDSLVEILETNSSDRTRSAIIVLEKGDDPEIYTGTRQRFLIPKVYGPIFIKGGPLGYGTVDSSGFPPENLPGLPTDPAARERVRNIDNSYMNVGLRFGWVGLVLFAGLLISSVWCALQLAPAAATYLFPSDWRIAVAHASIAFSLIFQLATIHFSYDLAFWVIFQMGCIAGLTSRCARIRAGDTEFDTT